MAQIKFKIDSILGGHSPTYHFGTEGQYLSSLAIDPELAYSTAVKASGSIIPIRYQDASSTGLSGAPMWLATNPKDANLYLYASDGELISYNSAFTETVIGTPTSGAGNGMAYYNDYIYLATPTNISRYGQLSGTPSLTNTVWTGATLGSQPALINTTYPTTRNVTYPNHAMHVHVNNVLYFCDYNTTANGGKGVLHGIKTTSTGTDDGSDNDLLDLPFGYIPTDIESWGNDLVISTSSEGSWASGAIFKPGEGAIFFWDTTSSSFYKQINLKEPLVTALYNKGGELYIWAGHIDKTVTLYRYTGGDTLVPLWTIGEGSPPYAGAVDGTGNQISWGAYGTVPATFAGTFSYGYRNPQLPRNALNSVSRITNTSGTLPIVSAIKYFQTGISGHYPVMGWRVDTTADYGLDRYGGSGAYASFWRSQVFNLGQEFIIRNVRLSFPTGIATNHTITPTIFVDDDNTSTALTTINNTNYTGSERVIDINATVNGKSNFYLQLAFTGTAELPVNLPITITVDTLND